MNCLEYLLLIGYNLKGYSPDTYYFLSSHQASGQCEAILAYAEARFG